VHWLREISAYSGWRIEANGRRRWQKKSRRETNSGRETAAAKQKHKWLLKKAVCAI